MIVSLLGEIFSFFIPLPIPATVCLAIGTSSHALGTAKAMEIGDVEGAMSSLSIAFAGLITVGLFSFFVNLY